MKRPPRRLASALAVAAILATAAACTGQTSAAPAPPPPSFNPVIFVHGFTGSAAQFESQKLRFMENGYPENYVRAFEYDSTFSLAPLADVQTNIDRLIAQVKSETGKARVDTVGHSLGTSVLQGYLRSSAARAANVGHYVNVDGQTATSLPGGVPTLAVWAGLGTPGRKIDGATNVIVPNQTHVQSVSSAETFAQLFTFLTGHDPRQTNVVAERGDQVTVAGRAVLFPYNSAVLVATLQVWELQAATGQHVGKKPLASITLGADGSWAPTRVKRGAPYEFAILRPGAPTQHFYLEPFRRSDYLIRLLTATPNGGLDTLVDKSDRHVSMVINRNKEFWGDEGMPQDALTVNGTNIVNSATAPISHRTNAIFVFDKGSDQQSDVNAALPAFFAQPFLSGVDLFVPAATPATGTVSVALTSRGGGPVRTVNFPSFPSTKDQVTVPLNDFE